jgi:hypothetical protein
MSMRRYVEQFIAEYPELLDLVAADDSASSGGGSSGADSAQLFPAHLPMSEVQEGLKNRRLLKGTIRCERESSSQACYVVVHAADGVTRRSVQIKGEGVRVQMRVGCDVM